MKRRRPARPRVKLNRDAVWTLLDELDISKNVLARRCGVSVGDAFTVWWVNPKLAISPILTSALTRGTAFPLERQMNRLHRRTRGYTKSI